MGAFLNANDNHLNNPLSPGSVNPGFGTVGVPCTTGFYETIFNGDARPSDDCIYAVQAQLQTRTENQQDVLELNFQGGIVNLPAGELRGAFGYQGRRNSAQFNPDILQSTASFRDQVIGVYPTGYLDAETTVGDYYGELLIPVIGGFKWLKNFELDIGGRQSDYKNTDDTFTFKVNANVEINDKLRFRGGFNRATRAPNLGEMYLNLQQVFGAGGQYGDPCGVFSNSPYGAGGAIATNPYDSSATAPQPRVAGGQTAAGAQSTYLICRAQMGADAAGFFYGVNNTLPPAGSPAPGGFAWNNQMGNPDLKSETADTWTAGFVVQSPWESAGLRGLSATVDWYKISMEDVIEPYSVDYARYLCYGTKTVTNAAEAAAQAATEACQNVPRNTGLNGGGALTQLLKYANQATIETAGIDFAINWFANLNDIGVPKIPGGIGLNVQGTWLDYYKSKLSPTNFDPVIDWKGSLGPNVPGFNGGAYSYRLFSSLSYNLPTMNFSLRWRYLPRVDQYAKAQERAIIANNNRVVNGGDGIILSYTPTTLQATPSYSNFDFSFNWNITDTYSVRAGVDNLFDKEPEIAGNTSKQTGYPDNLNVVTALLAARTRRSTPSRTRARVRRAAVSTTPWDVATTSVSRRSSKRWTSLTSKLGAGGNTRPVFFQDRRKHEEQSDPALGRAASLVTLASILSGCVGPHKVDHRKALADSPVVATIPMAAPPDVPQIRRRSASAFGYRRVVKDGVETFCSNEPVTGSRMETFERCLTRAQIEAFRQNAELFMRRQQTGAGEPFRPNPGAPAPQPTPVTPPPH